MTLRFVLIATVMAAVATAAQGHSVKHMVVLMMENRSFDHMLGWLRQTHEVDGLDGSEFNEDIDGRKVWVSKKAPDEAKDDPLHDFDSVTEQIYGFQKPVDDKDSQPTMGGFVQVEMTKPVYHVDSPMAMFTPETAPIISALAQEFVTMDRWFCSLPGPTDPNRAFSMSGTSNGHTANFNLSLWTQQSYFDLLRQQGRSFRAYYHDDPWAVFYFKDMVHKPENNRHVHKLEKFFEDVENGFLPDFTWLQPRMTSHKGHPDWQHPDSSVREGERLIKKVYEALRASSLWNDVVFVLTYDEHGGFYDHVVPPQTGVPSPDDVPSPEGFDFSRLGVRIPTLVISPWVHRGQVVGRPNGPTATSEYEGTSVIATANKLFGISSHVSKRVSWAGTFDDLFSERELRRDCPLKLPELPAPSQELLYIIQTQRSLNDHLLIQIAYYCKFNHRSPECGEGISNQLEASLFIEQEVAYFLDHLPVAENIIIRSENVAVSTQK